MAGGNRSKAKGNSGELALAKILSGIFGGSFQRVPNSGAFTGGKNFVRRAVLSDTQNRISRGDLITPDHLPKMLVECKSYAEFPYHAFLTKGPIPLLEGWIKQCYDAIEEGDFWYIAFKVNRKFWTIVVPEELAEGMQLNNYAHYNDGSGKKFIVTELIEFMSNNKENILHLSA